MTRLSRNPSAASQQLRRDKIQPMKDKISIMYEEAVTSQQHRRVYLSIHLRSRCSLLSTLLVALMNKQLAQLL